MRRECPPEYARVSEEEAVAISVGRQVVGDAVTRPQRSRGVAIGPRVIRWDGTHVPEELRNLPPGRYAIEPIDDAPALSDEEEGGILTALDELDVGRGFPLGDVVRDIRGMSPLWPGE